MIYICIYAIMLLVCEQCESYGATGRGKIKIGYCTAAETSQTIHMFELHF
jgi:hypothetical protein